MNRRPKSTTRLAAPGITEGAAIAALDRAIQTLVEQRNAIATASPFKPALIEVVEVARD